LYPVTDYNSLVESITLYVSRAAEKLRKQQSFAGSIYVFIRTSEFKSDQPYYSNGMTISMPSPTDDASKDCHRDRKNESLSLIETPLAKQL